MLLPISLNSASAVDSTGSSTTQPLHASTPRLYPNSRESLIVRRDVGAVDLAKSGITASQICTLYGFGDSVELICGDPSKPITEQSRLFGRALKLSMGSAELSRATVAHSMGLSSVDLAHLYAGRIICSWSQLRAAQDLLSKNSTKALLTRIYSKAIDSFNAPLFVVPEFSARQPRSVISLVDCIRLNGISKPALLEHIDSHPLLKSACYGRPWAPMLELGHWLDGMKGGVFEGNRDVRLWLEPHEIKAILDGRSLVAQTRLEGFLDSEPLSDRTKRSIRRLYSIAIDSVLQELHT